MNDEELRGFVERLADRAEVDWTLAERRLGPTRLRGLRRVESIVSAYRRIDAPAAATRFRHLQLQHRLGGGFGGEVWRAWDSVLERSVALKLRPAGAPDPRHEARLLDEARALARVDHPNVLRVLGAGVDGGRFGVWSEYVDGEDLETRLRRDGRLGAGEARSLGAALCAALAAVHGAGFVHGDVKPANVMRTRDGRHVLCDLGSATPLRGDGRARPLTSGSPLYLAPEVLEGGRPGVAVDVYALGATLFHLLGGRTPVEGDDIGRLLAAHRDGRRARLRDLRPDLPAALVEAVERAVAPDPARRFASAAAFEQALLQQSAPARSLRWPAIAMIAALALVAVLSLRMSTAPAGLASDVQWRRGDGTPLRDGDGVREGDTLSLELRCARPCRLLVFAEDGTHAVSTLYPSPPSQRDPQPANSPIVLPGTIDGRLRHWRVGPAEGPGERLLLIAAERDSAPLVAAPAVALVDAPRLRGIDAIVDAPTAPTAGLDAMATELVRSSPSRLELHWLRLHRSDAKAPPKR